MNNINPIYNINSVYLPVFKQKTEESGLVTNPITQNDVSMQGMEALANYNKSMLTKTSPREKFDDVYREFSANVPDRTSTLDEKRLAISYINRFLNCEDIEPKVKNYWMNKKTIIQNEMILIKHEQQKTPDNLQQLENEFWSYSNEIWNREVEFENIEDRVEYWCSYYLVCISYIDKILNCKDLPDNKKQEYVELKKGMEFDLNNHISDLEMASKESAGH